MRELTQEQFLSEVKDHQIDIKLDNGLYRHITFSRPNTRCMMFGLVTWPGYLAYYGDMGEFMFTRVEDMFTFFRGQNINPQYWEEKCYAIDRCDGIRKFSPELFCKKLMEWAEEYCQSTEDVNRDDFMDDVSQMSRLAHDDPHYAMRNVIDYSYAGKYPFQNFYETQVYEFTHRYLWCCYAMVWGIDFYDKIKSGEKLGAAL